MGLRLYFRTLLSAFKNIHFEEIFYQDVTVYLVRIWAFKNADEKAHTFYGEANTKKRTKTDTV